MVDVIITRKNKAKRDMMKYSCEEKKIIAEEKKVSKLSERELVEQWSRATM